MLKKALQLASVASMIDQFIIPNIQILQSFGYSVDVVADFTNPGTITQDRAKELINKLNSMNVRVFDISIPRFINIKAVSSAFKEVKQLITKEHYNLIHCHSPIGGAITRLSAIRERKKGTKVFYTAHGFHFYKGSSIKNWILFYPIERYLSKYTDVLITINKEDFELAKKRFRAIKTVYVPGVGVDVRKFIFDPIKRNTKRDELGIRDDDYVFLSIGELNENKNHSVIVEAIGMLDEEKRNNTHYLIAGKDTGQSARLTELAKSKKVKLQLLGYRTDINDLLSSSDVFILPSIREGLNVGLLEAMVNGLICIASDIRGNRDLINSQNGYLVKARDTLAWKNVIDIILNRKKGPRRKPLTNWDFSSENVKKIMVNVYKD